MPLVIGIDEAGYGPNLGPLVIGATAWQVADATADLYDSLSQVIGRPGQNLNTNQFAVGDSKQLYSSGGSLQRLETAVLAMLGAMARMPGNLPELLRTTAAINNDQLKRQIPYCWQAVAIPNQCPESTLAPLIESLRKAMENSSVELKVMQAAVLFPDQFNAGLETHGNKSTVLTATTFGLIRKLLDSCTIASNQPICQPIHIICDRHGGRQSYAGLLQQELTDWPVRVVCERREESVYRWVNSMGNETTIRFVTGGEQFLPVAAGSMIAKYLRELTMKAWNRYWQQFVPDLKPTAGYPVDAKRFRSEIAEVQKRQAVPDELIWRVR